MAQLMRPRWWLPMGSSQRVSKAARTCQYKSRMRQEAPGGLRRPQEAPGDPRRLQEAPGGFRRPQEASDGPRRPHEAPGGPAEVSRGPQRHQEAPGGLRRPQEAPGARRIGARKAYSAPEKERNFSNKCARRARATFRCFARGAGAASHSCHTFCDVDDRTSMLRGKTLILYCLFSGRTGGP